MYNLYILVLILSVYYWTGLVICNCCYFEQLSCILTKKCIFVYFLFTVLSFVSYLFKVKYHVDGFDWEFFSYFQKIFISFKSSFWRAISTNRYGHLFIILLVLTYFGWKVRQYEDWLILKTKYYWTWLWFYNFNRKFTTCMVWTYFIFLSHLQIFAVQRHFTHQSNSLQHGLILQSNFVYQSSLNQWNYKQQKNIMKWNGRKYTWMNLHFTKTHE